MGLAQVMRQSYVNGGLGLKVETGNRVPGDTNEVVGVFNITGEVAVTLLTAQVVTDTRDNAATIRVYHHNTPTTVDTFFNAALGSILTAIPDGRLLQFPDVNTVAALFVDDIVPLTGYLFGVLGGFGISCLMSTGQIRYVIGTADSDEGLLAWYLYYIPISWHAEITPAF